MIDLSTNNSRITVKFEDYNAIVIDNFDPSSDMWTPADRQTADGEMTPDGSFNYWAINSLIETTLTVSGASEAGRRLRAIADANIRQGDALSFVSGVTVVVETPYDIEVYYDGIMTGSKAGRHFGNQKIQPQVFKFKFAGKQ